MTTLILSPRYTEDSQKLWRGAISLGWDVERLANWQIPPRLFSVEKPVIYLEGLMAGMVAQQLKISLIEPREDWLCDLPQKYRKRAIAIKTFKEAKNLQESAFIKPPNEKSFLAGIYRGAELPEGYPEDGPVLISEIVQWECEFRCFILHRQLQTFSIYLRDGELQRENGYAHSVQEEQELKEYVRGLLADSTVQLPPAIVLDVGVIKDKGWAVVELNSAWGSGIYGCDPVEVLEVLKHSVKQDSQDRK